MKALVKMRPGPGLELVDIALPVVGAGDVLVKVKATGICGTDLHIEVLERMGAKDPAAAGHRGP